METGRGKPRPSLMRHSLEREGKNMDRLLTINGRSYKAAEFDLNLICDFEDRGISLEDIGNKMFNVIRQYVASSMGVDHKTAGVELSAHLANGGKIEDITDVMNASMEDSGFFPGASKNKSQADSPRTRKKKAESEEVTS